MILNICDDPDTVSVLNTVVTVIKIIRIAVPILLILALMISFVRAIMNNDNDALEKAKKGAVSKIIAAVLIFLIPTFVNLITEITGATDYKECINLNTIVDVKPTYKEKGKELIEKYRDSEEDNDYYTARNYIYTIRYQDIKNELLEELEALHDEIEARKSPSGEGVIDGSCYAEYANGYGLASIRVDLSKVKGTNYKFINAGRVVQEGSSTTYQSTNNYELLIHPSIEVKLDNGRTKRAECEVKHIDSPKYYKNGYYFQKQSSTDKTQAINNPYPKNGLSYYAYFPKDLASGVKVPLVLALHGGFGWGVPCKGSTTSEGNQTYHFLKTALLKNRYPINNVDKPEVDAIVIAPSNMTCNWEPSIPKAMSILYAYVKLFNVDVDRVTVTGTSQGGYGTMYIGFLEEQIIYSPTNNDTTLESVAKMYNTTVSDIIKYNKSVKQSISYSDKAQTKLKAGSHTVIKPKSEENMRSLFSVLIPMSPAKNQSRCIFTPSTIYDDTMDCKKTPPYTLRTPIWVITSNDEYPKIQRFAKELTAYYEKNGDIRYTILTKLPKYYKTDEHNTQVAILGHTSAFNWIISQKYGSVHPSTDPVLDNIEKQLGNAFVKDFHP